MDFKQLSHKKSIGNIKTTIFNRLIQKISNKELIHFNGNKIHMEIRGTKSDPYYLLHYNDTMTTGSPNFFDIVHDFRHFWVTAKTGINHETGRPVKSYRNFS